MIAWAICSAIKPPPVEVLKRECFVADRDRN
jgi:hypothetical protein